MDKHILLLCPEEWDQTLRNIILDSKAPIRISRIESKDQLINLVHNCQLSKRTVLISFGTGIIVPNFVLENIGMAYNIHAATPDYPGRDPHHFAHYQNAKTYGATLHVMTENVDAGPIISIKSFTTSPYDTPLVLLEKANLLGLELFKELVTEIIIQGKPITPLAVPWGNNKGTRKKFLKLCEVNVDTSEVEFKKKYMSFQNGVSYKNLYIDIHGYRFRIEGKID